MCPGSQIPFQKIGTVFQNPAWRFEALQNPFKYRLKNFISREGRYAGHLKRYLYKGLKREVSFKYPSYLVDLCAVLPTTQSLFLQELWAKHYKKVFKHKVHCEGTTENGDKIVAWNLREIDAINDSYFCKIANHIVGEANYPEITFALTLGMTPELKETFCALGYMIYAGLSDTELAKRWKISVKRIEAVRMLFFDFSHFPMDRIARWALLNQLRLSGIIDDKDFGYYKRIYDLGELGLLAQVDYLNLTFEDRAKINDYLASSMVINTLNLNLGIKTARDSLNYTRVVTDFARLSIEKEELRNAQVQTEIAKIRLSQLAQQASMSTDNLSEEDQKLLEKMRELSLQDATDIPYTPISDLK